MDVDPRMAENQRRFRLANERIDAARAELEFSGETVPFLCECPDPTCTSVIAIAADEYAGVRADDTLYILLPGHVPARERVVEERKGYVVTSKEQAA